MIDGQEVDQLGEEERKLRSMEKTKIEKGW